MKSIALIVVVMSISMLSQAQSKSVETLFNKYKAEKDFFHMDLGGSFLNFAEGMDLHLDEGHMGAITKSIDKVKLFKLPVSGATARADFKALEKGLKKERFDVMMELSEKDNGIVMYSKGGKKISDIILLISGKGSDDHMVIALEGDFDAKTIAKAGQQVTN